MPPDLSSELKRFIYEKIDSIGFLEALLLLRSDLSKPWDPSRLATELRNNPTSVAQYLKKLEALKLVRRTPTDQYIYEDPQPDLREIIDELAECYRVQRHTVIELIYSPLKKARDFSEAFVLPGLGTKKEGSDD